MPLHLPPPEGSPRWYRWYEQELLKRHVDIQRLWQLAPMTPAPQVGIPFTGVTVPTFFSVPSDLASVSSSSVASSESSSSSLSSSSSSSVSSSSSSALLAPDEWVNFLVATNTASGTVDWTDPDNARSDDSNYATCNMTAGQTSKRLALTQIDGQIPSAATVTGITLEVTSKASGTDVQENLIRLTKDGTNGAGSNLNGSNWLLSDHTREYGSDSFLWGTTWTPAEINAATFGVLVQVQSLSATRLASLKYVRIKINYTL